MHLFTSLPLALAASMLGGVSAIQNPFVNEAPPLVAGPLFRLFTVATSGNTSFAWHQIWSAGFTVTSTPLPGGYQQQPGVVGDAVFFINSTGALHDQSWNPWGLAEAGKGDAPELDRSVTKGVYGYLIEVLEGATTSFSIDELSGEVLYRGDLPFDTFTLCAMEDSERWGHAGALKTQLGWRSGDVQEDTGGCADVKLVARYL